MHRMNRMKPLVCRQGGKYRMYKTVIDSFPADYTDSIYVEPFVGGGSIFFNKKPSATEVINDLDTVLIALYRWVKENPSEIGQRINGLYTVDDFKRIKRETPDDLLDKAVQHYLLVKMSYNGFKTVFNGRNPSKDFILYSERMKSATIHNTDYLQMIKEYDSPNTFFYLDPPYEESSKTLDEYRDINCQQLADVLSSIQGRFLLSINDSETIRALFKGFTIREVQTRYSIKKRHVTELIITNYD